MDNRTVIPSASIISAQNQVCNSSNSIITNQTTEVWSFDSIPRQFVMNEESTRQPSYITFNIICLIVIRIPSSRQEIQETSTSSSGLSYR